MAFSTSTTPEPLTRAELVAQVGEVGEAVNQLRTALLTAQKPFTAGIVRGAEESLLIVSNMLTDTAGVAESEL